MLNRRVPHKMQSYHYGYRNGGSDLSSSIR
jgi:hypothetical protein